nr:MAG TPA: hypothetical protein [Caudoviricetes sp.]DAY49121.1 MAG TPA: hypothetical protein [Caudoviricetes sp.]
MDQKRTKRRSESLLPVCWAPRFGSSFRPSLGFAGGD